MATAEELAELFDPQQPLTSTKLLGLSGLTQEEAVEVQDYWQDASLPRRTALLDQLVTLAEDNPEVDFTEVLRIALEDGEPALRITAIDGLWECKERWLLDRLIAFAKGDDNDEEEVRAAATLALGKFALLGAFEELRPSLLQHVEGTLRTLIDDQEQPLLIRRRAIEALSQGQDPVIHDVIRAAYHSGELQLKLASLYAMGQACDEGWLPVLLTELKSDDPEVQFEAARACGEMEDPRAIPSLIELTKGDDPEIQDVAIEALGRIGGDEAKEALREITTWPDPHVQEAAHEALEELSSGEDPLSFK